MKFPEIPPRKFEQAIALIQDQGEKIEKLNQEITVLHSRITDNWRASQALKHQRNTAIYIAAILGAVELGRLIVWLAL